jgi:hypothetical protein
MFSDWYRLRFGDADEHLIAYWIRVSRRKIKDVIGAVADVPYTRDTREILRQRRRARLRQPPCTQPSNLSRENQFQENFTQYPTEILTAMIDVSCTDLRPCPQRDAYKCLEIQ